MAMKFEALIKAATFCSEGRILGGDFAGLAATFSPGDGSLIELPSHIIPEALKEWGQEPKCLEVLVSEDKKDDGELVRHTITVMPETGCGVDNLETVKVRDSIDLSSMVGEDTNVIALQYPTEADEELRVETIFGLANGYRLRAVMDLLPSDTVFAIQSPMALVLERRTNSVSSGGTIADGGGLDGRTVSMLLGEHLRQTPTFAEERMSDEILQVETDGMHFVSLPCQLSIAYGWISEQEWVLQVAQEENGVRRVVSRQFHVGDNSEELDFDVQSWEEEAQGNNQT
jgi:hypothetical protein